VHINFVIIISFDFLPLTFTSQVLGLRTKVLGLDLVTSVLGLGSQFLVNSLLLSPPLPSYSFTLLLEAQDTVLQIICVYFFSFCGQRVLIIFVLP